MHTRSSIQRNTVMLEGLKVSLHASKRMIERHIQEGIVDFIYRYGESATTDDGAERISLSKGSIKRFRKEYGAALAKALQPYRRAYIVVAGDTLVTVAYSKSPLHK